MFAHVPCPTLVTRRMSVERTVSSASLVTKLRGLREQPRHRERCRGCSGSASSSKKVKSGVGGLVLAAAAMQDRLRVSAGLLRAFEDEFLGSLERDVGIEIRCHVAVLGVALVLTVDNRGDRKSTRLNSSH